MVRFITSIILVSCLLTFSNLAFAKQSFFEDRYRGWLWFEEKELVEENKNEQSLIPTAGEAREMIEARKKELEDARFVMIESAYRDGVDREEFLAAVIKYRQLEEELHIASLKVGQAWSPTNLLNPECLNEYENPINIYGQRLKAEQDEIENAKILTELAKTSELFVFRQGNCPYCSKLEEHLMRFAKMYGFKVEAISADGSQSKYFNSTESIELMHALDMKYTPTVILVSDKDNHRYEIARGVLSIEGLERNCLLASKLLAENISRLGKQDGGTK